MDSMRDDNKHERPHRGSTIAHRGWRGDSQRVDLIVVGEKESRTKYGDKLQAVFGGEATVDQGQTSPA